MNAPWIFLFTSALAYYAFAAFPEPCTYNMSKWVERLAFLFTGTIILVSLYIPLPLPYFFLGVCYVVALSASYLGYVTWRVQWSDKPDSVVQVAMWLWDLAISLSFFYLMG